MFQIWLDGESKRCLYPGDSWGSVLGPEEVDRDRGNTWVLDGRPGFAFKEDGGVDEIIKHDTGLIGSRYTITLRVLGQYRTVEWEKAELTEKEQENLSTAKLKGSEANYFLYSSISDSLQKMNENSSSMGLFDCRVKLESRSLAFQIIRNSDWNQVIYSAEQNAGSEGAACGPDDYGTAGDYCWLVEGHVGDIFRICMKRTSECGQDSIRV